MSAAAPRGLVRPARAHPLAALLCVLGLAAAGTLVAGCAANRSSRPAAIAVDGERAPALIQAMTELRPATDWPGTFVLQQRVTVRWREGETERAEQFGAALQRKGATLLLVGLGPMQQVGFELRLEGGETRFLNRTGRDVPFRPENMLADVQRVFYPWLPDQPGCEDCLRSGSSGRIGLEEEWTGGRLRSRTFRVSDQPAAGEVRIEYFWERSDPAETASEFPARVHVENQWFGYALEIETLRSDRL